MGKQPANILLLDKLAALNTARLPVILLGDFNSEPQTAAIRLLAATLEDALVLLALNYALAYKKVHFKNSSYLCKKYENVDPQHPNG